MKINSKEKISVVAKTGGLKFASNPDKWVNPASEMAKSMVLRQSEELKGASVNVVLDDGKYLSVALLSEIVGEPVSVSHEDFDGADKLDIEQKEPVLEQYNKLELIEEYDYQKIRSIPCKIDKKGKFNYVSWSQAWDSLKQLYPKSTFKVKENSEGLPLFKFGTGGAVKITVTVRSISHSQWMPILDFYNKSVNFDKIDAFMVNTAIQRGLAKSIALHGLGLFVYHGEDLPPEQAGETK